MGELSLLRALEAGLYEAVDRRELREEAIEHGGEEEHAAVLEGRVVEAQLQGQAAHEGMHPVIAGYRGEAEIGDDEPLRGHLGPVFGILVLDLGGDHIGPGRHVAERVGHRNGRGGQRIGFAQRQINLAGPYLLADAISNVLGAIFAEIALENAVSNGGGDRAILNGFGEETGR